VERNDDVDGPDFNRAIRRATGRPTDDRAAESDQPASMNERIRGASRTKPKENQK
jgi:hypothetical protein